MKNRFFPTLSLLAVLLVSCAPVAATTESPPQPVAPTVAVKPSSTPVVESPVVEAAPTEALAPTPFPVATSRGPDLHATDPGTVSLAAGNLQFVEFFRFT